MRRNIYSNVKECEIHRWPDSVDRLVSDRFSFRRTGTDLRRLFVFLIRNKEEKLGHFRDPRRIKSDLTPAEVRFAFPAEQNDFYSCLPMVIHFLHICTR